MIISASPYIKWKWRKVWCLHSKASTGLNLGLWLNDVWHRVLQKMLIVLLEASWSNIQGQIKPFTTVLTFARSSLFKAVTVSCMLATSLWWSSNSRDAKSFLSSPFDRAFDTSSFTCFFTASNSLSIGAPPFFKSKLLGTSGAVKLGTSTWVSISAHNFERMWKPSKIEDLNTQNIRA